MNLPYKRIHIVGAGGAGMSALAKILVALGHEVSGSDLRGGASLQGLSEIGVSVFAGHNPEVAVAADLVVASSAVPEFDEELEAARASQVPVWRRPELLGALTTNYRTIGATGTHGKTTTTALMITALWSLGVDPSFVVGGELTDVGTNGHLGTDDLLVLEADEAFRTFESINLDGLVVTNIEPEHVEHFGTEQDLHDSFVSVARSVHGPVVVCLDDAGAATLAEQTGAISYGQAEYADWRVSDLATGDPTKFVLKGRGQQVAVSIPQPGTHVALDAAGALALLAELGYDLSTMAKGLENYGGVSRRWEHRGTVGGVTLVDDYAHHPTEVRATLAAASGMAAGRVWAIFQPHLYSRTERFSEEFGQALSLADEIVVTDIYGARETPVPGVTGKLVANAAERNGASVRYVAHRADLAEVVVPLVRPGDLVLSMGAGDITLFAGELATALAARQ